MGTSVGVGPFRTLSTIPAAISRLDRSIGASTTTSLRKSCFEWSSPSTKRFQRPGCAPFSVRADASSREFEDSVNTSSRPSRFSNFGVKNRIQFKAREVRRGENETLTKYFATCAPGLETVLAAELSSPLIGAQEVEVGKAGVSFVGLKVTGYKASLWLRTAVRVLVQLAAGPLPEGRGRNDPVYTFIRDAIDWPSILLDDSSSHTQQPDSNERYRPRSNSGGRGDEMSNSRAGTATHSAQAPRFRNFGVQSRVWSCTDIHNSAFASVRAKDAICDAMREACGGHRPEPPEHGGSTADVPLFLFLFRDEAVLYRDMSGVSLHKRGYRDVMHRASLNEGIAAAVLTIAGWNRAVPGFGDANVNAPGEERVLLDPMCGSGTFLIEAALMASNVAPGLMRRQWPFQKWHDFDENAWKQCKDNAVSMQQSSLSGVRLLGNDIHAGALSLCHRDASTAGVRHLLELSCKDIQEYKPLVVPSLVVTNPPWGERLIDSRFALLPLYVIRLAFPRRIYL
uniref:Uncharacterized protein n=1 Tax=Physcomitrium patens TaxID=3218 RepID=A0A7I4AT43_PHYPA